MVLGDEAFNVILWLKTQKSHLQDIEDHQREKARFKHLNEPKDPNYVYRPKPIENQDE